MKIDINENHGITKISIVFPTPENSPVSEEAVRRCAEVLQSGAEASDILNRKDYVAAKLWSFQDIEDCLRSYGYDPGAENAAIISKEVQSLNDCRESEWDVIYEAIEDNKKVLRPITMKLKDMLKILQATVDYMKEEIDEADALDDLKDVLEQMGFTEKQLVFFGAVDFDEPKPDSFSDTISISNDTTPDKEAYELILKIARWFYNDWKVGEQNFQEDREGAENLARDELEEIGFPEGIINAAWYSNDTD